MKPIARPLPLAEWQDAVEDVAIIFSENACIVYFWVDGCEKIGSLLFDGAWTIRSVRTELAPYWLGAPWPLPCILEVIHSPWPNEVGGFLSVESRDRWLSSVRHFSVKGHDIYHEILAVKYIETYIVPADAGFENAAQILTLAQAQPGVQVDRP